MPDHDHHHDHYHDGDERLVRAYVAAYNAFDVDAMLALLSPDVRFENWSGGRLTAQADGIGEFEALARKAATLFDEREQRITSLARKDGAIEAAIAYRGRLAVDVPGGPAAGTVLELTGASDFTVDAGRIAAIVDRS